MTAPLYTLDLQFRRPDGLPAPADQFGELFRFADALGPLSAVFRSWYLSWSTHQEDALTYPAFNDYGPEPSALAVLESKLKDVNDIRSISVWNGYEKGSSIVLRSMASVLGRPDTVSLATREQPAIESWRQAATWLEAALKIWPASFASFAPFWYSEKATFDDRPGVGWMLYLPQVLTAREVPEARALVAVNDVRGVHRGTLVVSVTDEPFSVENAEHVAIANAIEIRLADQDLLPRYLDL